MTLHAGEWPGSGDNVAYAVDKGVRRIGHAIALVDDLVTMQKAKELGVGLECCPTANVGGAKVCGPWNGVKQAGKHLFRSGRWM